MPAVLPPRARHVLRFLSAFLTLGALLATFATAALGHAGHAHVIYGPPAPDPLWPGAPAARDAQEQAVFQQELAQAPVEVDGECVDTAPFDGIGTGCRTEDGLLRVELAGGGDLITHGPDYVGASSDLNPSTTTPSIVAAVQNASRSDISCVPATEAHTQLIYAIPADGVDRSASKVAAFRQSVYEASAVVDNTSRMLSPTSGRRLRVACDGSNDATVMTMRLPRRAVNLDFSLVRTDVEAEYAKVSGAGNSTRVRYLVYYDAHLDGFAGIGSLFSDTTASASNNNNRSEGMALQDNSSNNGPDWFVLLHEMSHNMGAVQDGAPDSNEVSHCNDGRDVMCYGEPGTPGVVGTYTETTCVELQFDCDHDSYFHPDPTTPWLQSHWNVAATYNRYLDAYAATSDTTAPATPTGFAGVGHGDFIRLTWNAVADSDLHTYRVERDTGGGVWRAVGDAWLGGTTLDATWTGIAANTSYSLRVSAYDRRGNLSAASTPISVNTGATDPDSVTVGGPTLASPINAVVESSTSSTITLRWEAPQTSGATGWELDKEHAGGWFRAQWGFGSGSGTITLSTISTGAALAPATRYQYRIRLTDDWGRVSSSVTIAGWTKTAADVTAPLAPASLVVASSAGTSPRLTWATAVDAVDYVVALESFPGSNDWTQQAVVTSPTFTLSGLAHATTHSIGVQARDEAGNVSPRSTVSFVAPTAPSLQAPTDPTISNVSFVTSHTTIGYSWAASTDDGSVTYHMLYMPSTSTIDWLSGPTVSGLSGTITGLKPGTQYRVSVEAIDNDGHTRVFGGGSYYNITTTADTTAPSQPPTLLATGMTENSMQLDWGTSNDTGGSGVAGYRVYRTSPAPELLLTTTAPGVRTYTPTGLAPNTSYTYAVEAFDFGDNVSTRSTVTQSTLPPSDPIPPTTPGSFTTGPGALTETTAPVQWTAGTDNVAVTGYDIYRTAPTTSSSPVLSVGAVTGATIPGLTRATSYTFEIAARDAAGNVSTPRRALSFTTPDLTAPTTPGTPVVSALTASSATLTWTASTDSVGPITYTVARLLPAADFSTTTATTSQALTGLSQATTYQYRVTASDGAGNVSGASTVTFSTPDVTPPIAPTSFTTGTITETTAVLNWSGASDNVGVTGYRIYRITAGPTSTLASSPLASDATVTLNSLSPGTAYTFEIAARDAATLESMPRRSLSFTTPDVTAPTAPGTPVASNNDGDGVTLTWTGSSDNVAVTGYRIEQVTPSVTTLATIPGLSYDVTGLDDAASYSYRVYARDAVGNETVSGTRVVDTPDITVPTQPGTITPSAATSSSVTLTWGASTDNAAVTGYRVYLGATTGGTLLHSPTGTSQTISGLLPNTPYTFTVVARDAAGLVSPGRTITTSTGDTVAPATPANLHTTTRSGSSITLAWDASTDDVATTEYRVYQGAGETLVATVAGTSTTIGSLTDATDYSFKVEARDAATNTSARSAAHATFTSDTQGPTQPGAMTVGAVTATSIALTWGAASDSRSPITYELRNGSAVGTLLAPPTTTLDATITGLSDGVTYHVFLVARDPSTNASTPRSASIPIPDQTAPSAPSGLAVSNEDGDGFDLDWADSGDNVGVLFYRVYVDGVEATTSPSTSATLNGLDDGTTYDVEVTAVDAAGNESAADDVQATTTDVTAPNAPATVSTGAITNTSVSLSWTAASDNVGVTAYRVYDATGGSRLVQLAGTSYVANGLSSDTDYEFEVTALDAAGNESARTSRTAHTALGPDVTAPSTPGAVTFDMVAATSITMSWVASTDDRGGAVSYQVRANTAAGAVLANNLSATSATIGSLVDGTTYTFAIVAVDAASNVSTARIVSQQTLDTTPPTAPGNLRATDVGATTVDLAWNVPFDNVGVTGYRVRQVGVAGLLASPTGTTYQVTGLADDSSFSFEVEARDLAGHWSATATLTVTTDDVTAPGVPTGFVAAAASQASINLSWIAPPDADVASYRLYMTAPNPSGTPIATVPAGATTFTVASLLPSTAYSFEVAAVDDAGNPSATRASATASTDAPDLTDPSAPTFAGISNVTTTGARISWNPATDADSGIAGYQLQRFDGATWINVGGLLGALLTQFDITGLTPGTTTQLRLLALDAAGNDSISATITVATSAGADTTKPGVPTRPVTSTATAGGEVGLTWGAATDNVGVTDYRVSRLTGAGYIVQGTSATTAITLTGQPTGMTSTYAIAAVDAAGNISNPLTTSVFVPAPPAPPTPPVAEATPVSGLAATVTSTSISLAWQQPGTGTTGWRVVEIRNNSIVSTRDVSSPKAAYGPYAPKTAVRFVVYSLLGSTLSTGVTVDTATASDTVKPSKPGKLKATSPAKGTLALTWTRSTDDVTLKGYEVKLTTKGAKPKVVKLPASALKAKVVKLKLRAAYSVQIRALDTAGNASAWATVNTRTK